jgi:hypothetical protein
MNCPNDPADAERQGAFMRRERAADDAEDDAESAA